MNPLVPWIRVAGLVILTIATANALVPGKLRYRENLVCVSPIVRQVFVLHSIYIVMVVIGFAGLCLFFAEELAGASALGRSISAFLAILWLSRAIAQLLYIDGEIKRAHQMGHIAYTLATIALGAIFATAALG